MKSKLARQVGEGPNFIPISINQLMESLPESGKSYQEEQFESLTTRWNREEAQAVERSKRTLQSPQTSSQAKIMAINELEYWAIRRGGYDAEIILIGALKNEDADIAGAAHISLKKTWGSHFNAWVNSAISSGKAAMDMGYVKEVIPLFDKIIFENPLWGEAYHLRAKCYNQLKDVNQTIADLRKTLEFCPNNYLVMVELAITLMDKVGDYDGAYKLFQNAVDLCPFLPVRAFTEMLYVKAPHLKALADAAAAADQFSFEAPPGRLMPDAWVDKFEATERPNQAFLRVGAELEQWFTKMRNAEASKAIQRKLWSKLVIAWDPDKHPPELKSFTTQVHEVLKARRERELAKVEGEDDDTTQVPYEEEETMDARTFLKKIRAERAEKRRQQEAAAAR